jgi:hypothetical protein
MSAERKSQTPAPVGPAAQIQREADALYQNNRVVARAVGAEVDLEAKEIRFEEIYNSDDLLLPEECDFQKFAILIQRIAFATKIDRGTPEKGRVLRGVVAGILRYREQ